MADDFEARLARASQVGQGMQRRALAFANATPTPAAPEQSSWDQGLGGMLNPLPGLAKLGGDIANTGLGMLQAIPTAVADVGMLGSSSSGEEYLNDINRNSILSHLVNTDAIRASAIDEPFADRTMGVVGQMAPAVGSLASGFAQTGINLGATAAGGINALAPREGRASIDNPYAEAYRQHRLAPVVVGDIANLAIAGKAMGGLTSEAAKAGTLSANAAAEGATDETLQAAAQRGPMASAVGNTLAPIAPQLEQASLRLGQGTELANKIAGAPLTIPFAGAKLGLKGLGRVGDYAFPAMTGGIREAASNVADVAANRAMQSLSRSNYQGSIAAPSFVESGLDREALQGIKKLDLTPAEEQAMHAIADQTLNPTNIAPLQTLGQAPAAELVNRSGPVVFNGEVVTLTGKRIVDPITHEARGVTTTGDQVPLDEVTAPTGQQILEGTLAERGIKDSKALDVADRYYAAKAAGDTASAEDQALVAKIDQGNAIAEAGRQRQQERFGAGFGTKTKYEPGSAEEAQMLSNRANLLGREPLMDLVARDVADPMKAAEAGRMTPERAQEIAGLQAQLKKLSNTPEQVQAIHDQLDSHAADLALEPLYAPPAWRSAVQAGRDYRDELLTHATQLEGESPNVAAELRRAANQIPDNIDALQRAGISDPAHLIGGEFEQGAGGARGPGLGKSGAEYMKAGVKVDRTAQGQAVQQFARYQKQLVNEFYKNFVKTRGRSADQLGLIGSPKQMIADAKDAGFVPVHPDDLRVMGPRELTGTNVGNAVWIPRGIADGIKDMQPHEFSSGTTEAMAHSYDALMRGYKAAHFLTPSKLVQRVIGHGMMVGVGSDVSLTSIMRNAKQTIDEIRNPDADMAMVLRRDPYRNEGLNWMVPAEQLDELKRPGVVGRVIQGNYKMMGAFDDFLHGSLYLAKREAGKEATSIADADLAAGRISPEAHADIIGKAFTPEKAVDYALKVGGDLTNMSSMERAVMMRIMPFYSWYKHITKLVMRMPVDNPYRLAWVTHLGDMYRPPDDTPDRYKENLQLGGGQFLGLPGGNILAEGSIESPLLNPKQALGALSPVANTAAAAMNLNLHTGELMSHPTGMGPMTNGKPSAGFVGLPQLGYYALGETPQTKIARDTYEQHLHPNSVIFPMGEGPMLTHGTSGTPIPLPQQSMLGVPTPITDVGLGIQLFKPDLVRAPRLVLKREKAATKAANRYSANASK